MIFDLPTSVTFGGREWEIATDYRDVLRVLTAFEDPDLTDADKAAICLYNMYVDLDEIPAELAQDALDAAVAFIDAGHTREDTPGPRTVDWTQDAPLIFPAVNRVAGYEVRAVEYMHWWTFVGLFMEIKDTTYSTILSLRAKKGRGKKLEKWEQEYWSQNKKICAIQRRYTQAELEEQERLRKIIGG